MKYNVTFHMWDWMFLSVKISFGSESFDNNIRCSGIMFYHPLLQMPIANINLESYFDLFIDLFWSFSSVIFHILFFFLSNVWHNVLGVSLVPSIALCTWPVTPSSQIGACAVSTSCATRARCCAGSPTDPVWLPGHFASPGLGTRYEKSVRERY